MPLIAVFLREDALHRFARDRDLDVHLVGRALRATRPRSRHTRSTCRQQASRAIAAPPTTSAAIIPVAEVFIIDSSPSSEEILDRLQHRCRFSCSPRGPPWRPHPPCLDGLFEGLTIGRRTSTSSRPQTISVLAVIRRRRCTNPRSGIGNSSLPAMPRRRAFMTRNCSRNSISPISPPPAVIELAARVGVVEQQGRQLVGQLGEEVGDRMRVEPQPGRRDQAKLLDLAMGDRRHLGRDHAAHRMPDHDRLAQASASITSNACSVTSSMSRRSSSPVDRRSRAAAAPRPGTVASAAMKRIVRDEATGAVQEQQGAPLPASKTRMRATAARLENRDLHSAATRSGTGSFIGWLQNRSSWFCQSGHRLRRCGITFSANSRVE